MNKPVIEIRYYGDAPKVQVPEGLDVEITLVDGDAEELRVIDYNGVELFWCVSDCDIVSSYYVSDCVRASDEASGSFDIRELPNIPWEVEAKYQALFPDNDDQQVLAYAIDQGVVQKLLERH